MKKELTNEQKNAWSYLNGAVKGIKTIKKGCGEIKPLNGLDIFQMSHLLDWCKLLEMPYERVDWAGNVHCESNWDEVFFVYKGIRFFELVEKEIKNEGE